MEVSVHYAGKIYFTLVIIMSECIRADRLCIRDSVKSQLVRKFCYRVQGSKKTVLLCAVRRVCSR